MEASSPHNVEAFFFAMPNLAFGARSSLYFMVTCPPMDTNHMNDNVLYHSLSRPKAYRKKNADAIEFCELGEAVSAMFIKW